MTDDTVDWLDETSKPTRRPADGPRHRWTDAGPHRSRCTVCGLVRLLDRQTRRRTSSYNTFGHPIARYFVLGVWVEKRPPCVGKNTYQASLFPDPDGDATADPRATVSTQPRSTARSTGRVVHEGELLAPLAPEPTPYVAPRPRVFQIRVGNLPEGVEVNLEVADDGYFASEYRWHVFLHAAPGVPTPRLSRSVHEASVQSIDKIAASLMRALGRPTKGLWIVARVEGGRYTRAWEGDGVRWMFFERGDLGEGTSEPDEEAGPISK